MKFVAAILGLLLCGNLCFGQENRKDTIEQGLRDMSGTWTLDNSKGKSTNSKQGSSGQITLDITQREPEIRITRNVKEKGRERINELVYYSDGRGETNDTSLRTVPPTNSGEKVRSKTRWDGNRLVTKYSLRWMIASDVLYFDVVETWELAPDGKTLIHTIKNSRPQSAFNKTIFAPGVLDANRTFYNRVSPATIK